MLIQIDWEVDRNIFHVHYNLKAIKNLSLYNLLDIKHIPIHPNPNSIDLDFKEAKSHLRIFFI